MTHRQCNSSAKTRPTVQAAAGERKCVNKFVSASPLSRDEKAVLSDLSIKLKVSGTHGNNKSASWNYVGHLFSSSESKVWMSPDYTACRASISRRLLELRVTFRRFPVSRRRHLLVPLHYIWVWSMTYMRMMRRYELPCWSGVNYIIHNSHVLKIILGRLRGSPPPLLTLDGSVIE